MTTYSGFDFGKVLQKLESSKHDVPLIVANKALLYFNNAFRTQEWSGKKWKEVQRRIPGTDAYKYPKALAARRHRAQILVGTYPGRSGGTLKAAVNSSLREYNWQQIKFGIDTPYAAYHNEGTETIPQRRFMGDAPALRKELKTKLESELKKIFVR